MDKVDIIEHKQVVLEALLKNFAFLILEIAADETITGIWSANPIYEKQYREKLLHNKISGIRNDTLIEKGRRYIADAFNTGKTGRLEYIEHFNNAPAKFVIRIFPATYQEDRVLVVIELVAETEEIVEDKWRLALDAAGDGTWDANMVTGKIVFSPKWHEMFGYSEQEVSTVADWQEKIHPEDIEHARHCFEEYLSKEKDTYSSEIRYRCKDGSYKWILSRGTMAAHNAEGNPVRFVGTHTDIQQRKLQEERLKESEQKYKALFDHSEAWICTHTVDGTLLNVNPYACRSLNATEEELIGKKLKEFIPAPFADKFESEYLHKILKHGSAEGIMHILDKLGDVKVLLYKNYLFADAGDPYIIGFAQDITARVRMEDELKASIEIFANAFRYSGIGKALVSPEGKWLEVNNALCTMLGFSREELMQLSFQDITHPDDLEEDIGLVKSMLQREIDTYTLEKRYFSKTGKVIWASLTVSLVWNKDNTPKFFISQIVDITAQKELTGELYQKNNELEITRKSLLNKVSQLEELSHIIGHNLRGAATNIHLLTEILKTKHGEESASQEAMIVGENLTPGETMNMISDASESLVNSLESVLTISQISLNKDIPLDNCRFSTIIQNVISQQKGLIIEKEVTIETSLDVSSVLYPRPYLESILYNLISNAIKYRNPAVPSRIVITTYRMDGATKLSVRDNGLGIDMEKFGDRIFKLNQVFHSNKDSKGIGLYLVKTQIESLGGSITMNSKVNKGTEFIVTFAANYSIAE